MTSLARGAKNFGVRAPWSTRSRWRCISQHPEEGFAAHAFLRQPGRRPSGIPAPFRPTGTLETAPHPGKGVR